MVRKLKVLQHNVRHWQIHKTSLINIYNDINPDIILINEHSITNDTNIKILNYNTHTFNKTREHYAGTAVAIRNNLQYRLLDDFYTDMVGISIDTEQGPITIATTYIPPRIPYINFIDFHTLLSRDEPTYMLGDINASHRILGNTHNNQRGRHIHTLISQNKCIHLGPHFPTFLTPTTATHPDLVLANTKTFHNILLEPGPLTPSDHIPIIATISIEPIYIPITPRKSFHYTNWDRYREILGEIDTPRAELQPTLAEIDEHINRWTQAVVKATDETTPTITHRAIPGIKPTHTTRTLQAQYEALKQDIQINGPSLDRMGQLHALRYRLQSTYRELQEQTWERLIDNIDMEEDPQKFWNSINRMIGQHHKPPPYIKDTNGTKYHSPTEKEPLFRQHWSNIFSGIDDPNNTFDHNFTENIEAQVTQNADNHTPYHTANIDRLNEHCPPITLGEFNKTLRTFKQKAPGSSGITTKQLHYLPLNMRQYLINIFNWSLSAGYFPNPFKHAIMIFIPKGTTSQHDIKNYRPISLLEVHGKILDKILNNRLIDHLERTGTNNTRQHGFRRNRGTHTALADFCETIAHDIRNKHTIDIILRDVSKAFDKVWHTGLKYKITSLQLNTCFTRTLCSYLDNRSASIRLGQHIGHSFALNSGVPQGACLSPTLYCLYTHDLPDPIQNTNYICFADDITQITSGRYSFRTATLHTERAIRQISTYEQQWKIQTNKDKFKVVPISRRKTADIRIAPNSTLQYTNKGKMLGLQFNSRGIVPQVSTRVAIARENLNKINRFRNLNPKLKIRLYTALVRSTLTYPVIPLHTLTTTQTRRLQRVQNRALKYITNTHWTDMRTSKSLHQQCNIKPINIYLHDHAKTTWEKIQEHVPDLYNKHPILNDREHNTRKDFPSSKTLAMRPRPRPIYK